MAFNKKDTFILFTFYSIYIKTFFQQTPLRGYLNLHSTLFILKLCQMVLWCSVVLNLHSTLFILKLKEMTIAEIEKEYLHSTLFILKPLFFNIEFNLFLKFTFYSIYIKTQQLDQALK